MICYCYPLSTLSRLGTTDRQSMVLLCSFDGFSEGKGVQLSGAGASAPTSRSTTEAHAPAEPAKAAPAPAKPAGEISAMLGLHATAGLLLPVDGVTWGMLCQEGLVRVPCQS